MIACQRHLTFDLRDSSRTRPCTSYKKNVNKPALRYQRESGKFIARAEKKKKQSGRSARMVYAKVTDGKEIRKFRVESDVTFDALKKQIAGLFPSLGNGVEFNVQYRDAVGDVISISTDEEVRTALSYLSANETWLLQAVPVPRRAQRASGRGAPTKAARR